MPLVYRGLRTLHCMDLPPAARRLKANFSGVIAFDFQIDVVANTVKGVTKQKNLSGPSFIFNGNKYKLKYILFRHKVIDNRDSLKQIVLEKVLVLVNIHFSEPTSKSVGTR